MIVRGAGAALAAVLLVGAASATAQTRFRTETRVNLRRDPSTANPPRRVLSTGSLLEALPGAAPVNGFVHVVTTKPDTGWVSLDFIFDADLEASAAAAIFPQVLGLTNPAGAIDSNWERPIIASSTFTTADGRQCGPRGGDGGDFRTNRRKNRADQPVTSHAVTVGAILALPLLQAQAKPRNSWEAADSIKVAKFEGIPLTVTGFIAALKPQGGNQESTNCGFTGEANTDWHVAFVPTHTAGESNSVVVEPTPRFKKRHPNWKPAELAPWVGTARSSFDSVRVTGFLFFDPSHLNHLHTFRGTLWEIHPVTRIEVFDHLVGRWVDLDDH